MSSPAPVSVRVSPAERDLLQSAAKNAKTSLSDFIRRKAVEAAELEMMENRRVVIPAEDWERFEAWANSPAKELPKLKAQLAKLPSWKD